MVVGELPQDQSGHSATSGAQARAPSRQRRAGADAAPAPRLLRSSTPAQIPEDQVRAAASLSRGGRFSEAVALADLPAIDAIVCGSVAVTRDGGRCGKGEGYSDVEYALLRELACRR